MIPAVPADPARGATVAPPQTADDEESGSAPRGALTWFAVFGGIGAWMVHLVAEASFTRFSCTESANWLLHGLTAAMVAVALLATGLSWRLAQSGSDDDAEGSSAGTARFLGLFGVVTGVTNVVLILLEGSYVFFIRPCA